MGHVRGTPNHPQTQGSEQESWPRWGRVSPANRALVADLEEPDPAGIKKRERIKRQTIEHRRLLHRKLAA